MRKARKGMSEMLEEPYVPANLAGGRTVSLGRSDKQDL
jgi:hypothetical protein